MLMHRAEDPVKFLIEEVEHLMQAEDDATEARDAASAARVASMLGDDLPPSDGQK